MSPTVKSSKYRPAAARQRPGATSRAIATMTPPDACSGALALIQARLPAWVRLWQLFGGLVQGNCRSSNHPAAEGPRKPDRVRFAVEIDMKHDADTIAAMTEPVRLDPPVVEPSPHLRHRVDQPAIADANFDKVLHRTPPIRGFGST